MRLGILLAITVVVSIIGTLGYISWKRDASRTAGLSDAAAIAIPREKSCGPGSLWFAAQRLGVPLSLFNLEKQFRDGTCNGTTFSELDASARLFGLNSRITSTDWPRLKKHDGTAILFVSDGHFLTVDPRESASDGKHVDSIRMYDPNRLVAVWFSREELEAIWEGDAMLLTNPQEKRSGPCFAPAHCLEDSGLQRDEFQVAYRFPISNTGNEVLRLKVLGTSCKCSNAEMSRDEIAPGETGFLDAVYRLESKQGRFNGTVMVSTNDKKNEKVAFSLRGAIYRTSLLNTQSVSFGLLEPGHSKTIDVAAFDPGEGKLKILDTEFTLEKRIEGSPVQPSCQVSVTPYLQTSSAERIQHEITLNDSLLQFRVDLPANCPPGTFEFSGLVKTNIDSSPFLKMKVHGRVLPDLMARPAALVLPVQFNDQPQSDDNPESKDGVVVDANLSLECRSDSPVKKVDVRMDSEVLVCDSFKFDPDSQQLTMKIRVKNDIDQRWFEGTITCESSDGKSLLIPVLLTQKDQALSRAFQ